MKIGNFQVGKKVLIIAEIGSNHNGSFTAAKKMVKEAALCKADAVKFQVYTAENIVSKTAPLVSHVKGAYKTQYERYKSLEFNVEQYRKLASMTHDLGMIFLSSVFDNGSVDMMDEILPVYKIASGDLTNIGLIRYIVKKNKPIILSTGMATLKDIANALKIIPKNRLILLHCVGAYPTPIELVNLRTIPFLKKRFKIDVGYSDHTQGTLACMAAVALGAVVIEKHFTLDKSIPFGDHKLSASPKDLKQMVEDIRQLEQALGNYDRVPKDCEISLSKSLRRSLYAKENIYKNTKITEENIIALRPEDDISSADIDLVIGKMARCDIPEGQPLKKEYILSGKKSLAARAK